MSKIICSNIKCKYFNTKNYQCTCKNIELSYSNIATVNQGRKDVLECKSFELDYEYKELESKIQRIFEEQLDKDSDHLQYELDKLLNDLKTLKRSKNNDW